MPVADRFKVLDGNDLTDLAGFEDLFESFGIGGITQNMADSKHDTGFFHRGDDPFAGFGSGSHGFFQQDMVAEFSTGDSRSFVHAILGTDRHGITHLRFGGEFIP